MDNTEQLSRFFSFSIHYCTWMFSSINCRILTVGLALTQFVSSGPKNFECGSGCRETPSWRQHCLRASCHPETKNWRFRIRKGPGINGTASVNLGDTPHIQLASSSSFGDTLKARMVVLPPRYCIPHYFAECQDSTFCALHSMRKLRSFQKAFSTTR